MTSATNRVVSSPHRVTSSTTNLARSRDESRDLDALDASKSTESLTPPAHRAAVPSPPPRREAEFRRRRPVSKDPPGGSTEEDRLLAADDDLDAGDSDEMAGDPSRITGARRGKLVTFYRNGDPYYKVSPRHTRSSTHAYHSPIKFRSNNMVNLRPSTPHAIPTKWRSYRDQRFCDVISPWVYSATQTVIVGNFMTSTTAVRR